MCVYIYTRIYRGLMCLHLFGSLNCCCFPSNVTWDMGLLLWRYQTLQQFFLPWKNGETRHFLSDNLLSTIRDPPSCWRNPVICTESYPMFHLGLSQLVSRISCINSMTSLGIFRFAARNDVVSTSSLELAPWQSQGSHGHAGWWAQKTSFSSQKTLGVP